MESAAGVLAMLAVSFSASSASAQSGVLEVWSRSGPQAAATYQSVFDAFTAKTGIKVQYLATVEFETQLRARAASRDLPDVLIYDQTSMAPYAAAGMILPVVPEQIAGHDQLDEGAWNSVRLADGAYYGVPFSRHAQILLMRRDWREKLGFAVPKTHAELQEIALAFTTKDPDGNGANDTNGWSISGTVTDRGFFAWILSAWLWQQGGAWVSGGEGKYSVEVNSPQSVAALEYVQKMFCAEPVVAMPGALGGANPQAFFVSGKTGIFLHGPFAFSDFDKSLGADKYEVIMMPAGSAGSTTLQERTSIYFGATSDMPEEQKKLAEFLISPEGQTLGMTGPGQPVVRLPVNVNVDATAVYKDPRWDVVQQQYADSRLMTSDIDFTTIRVDIAETLLAIYTQCLPSAQGELDKLAQRMSDELSAMGALK